MPSSALKEQASRNRFFILLILGAIFVIDAYENLYPITYLGLFGVPVKGVVDYAAYENAPGCRGRNCKEVVGIRYVDGTGREKAFSYSNLRFFPRPSPLVAGQKLSGVCSPSVEGFCRFPVVNSFPLWSLFSALAAIYFWFRFRPKKER